MDKFWGSFYMASQKAGLSPLHPQRCSLKSVPWRWVPFLCFSPSSFFHSCFLGLLPKSTNYLQAQLRLCFLGKPWLRFTPRLIPSGLFLSDARHLLTSLSELPWRLWPQDLPLYCHHCLCPSQQRGPNYRPRVTYCFDSLLKWPPVYFSIPTGNWHYPSQLHFPPLYNTYISPSLSFSSL